MRTRAKLTYLLHWYSLFFVWREYFALSSGTAGKLIQEEDREAGAVKLQTYTDYIKSAGGKKLTVTTGTTAMKATTTTTTTLT